MSFSAPLVRAQAKVCHYRICTAPGGSLYLQEGQLFPSLEELLAYYKANWKRIQSPLLQPCRPQVGRIGPPLNHSAGSGAQPRLQGSRRRQEPT